MGFFLNQFVYSLLRTLEPRTEKEIVFQRKNLTFRILLNWWRFDLMVSWSSSAKNSRADESLIFSMCCPDGATLPYRATEPPYWIIVSEIAYHFLYIAFSVLGSRVRIHYNEVCTRSYRTLKNWNSSQY